MTKYRIVFRQAWLVTADPAVPRDITPDPVVVDADWIDTTEFGVGFYRAGGTEMVRQGVTVERGELILWVPVDLIRLIKEETGPESAPMTPVGPGSEVRA